MTTPSEDRDDAAPPPRHRPRWRPWAVSFLAWGLLGGFSILRSALYRVSAGLPPPDLRWIGSLVFSLFLGAVMTPAMLWLGRRFRFERRKWAVSAGLHLLFAISFALINTVAEEALLPWIGAKPDLSLLARFLGDAFINVLCYILVIAIGQAVDYHRLSNERTLRAAALEAELARAQLLALQMQLRPHFLFNALHTVGSLIRTGQDQTALRTLAGLGDLLRALLARESNAEVTLREELDFIELYLRIEQVRFQDRLRTHFSVDPAAMDAMVPNLILQPLVENAVRHGIEASEGEGDLEIRIARDGDSLRLEVRDSGTGPSNPAQGIGIGNTRARLKRLYGDDHLFELLHGTNGGACARLWIPFHRAAEAT